MLALSCVLLPSCSNDDGDASDNGGQASIKHLISVKITNEYGNHTISNINYDNKNRIVSYTEKSNEDSEIHSFNYNDNGSITYMRDGKIETTFKSEDGLIKIVDYGESELYFLEYNQKKLSSISYQYTGEEHRRYNYTWSNNNILEIELKAGIHYYEYASYHYEYTSYPCITPIIYYFASNSKGTPYRPLSGDGEAMLYAYGYFGDIPTPNLVEKSRSNYDDYTHDSYEFSYEFDDDGYVTKMTIVNEYYTDTFEYIWE